MCLIRIRPSSPPPSPTIPARIATRVIPPPTPRLSVHAPTPRLSIQSGPPEQRLSRRSSIRQSSYNKRYSNSSPLPSAHDVTRREGIEVSGPSTPRTSYVRERPKPGAGAISGESAAVKAVNFVTPPPSTITDSNDTPSTPIYTATTLVPNSKNKSPTTSSSSNNDNRIPLVRQGSEYSYGAGPVRSSATSVDQIQYSQGILKPPHNHRTSSTNMKVQGPTASVEVVVAQRGEAEKRYTIVRRISQSQGNGQGVRRHSRALSSGGVNTHWGDPRRSGASMHSNSGNHTTNKEPFGEEVPMRRLSSNPLPATTTTTTTYTIPTAPLKQGALNFNPPPRSSSVTSDPTAPGTNSTSSTSNPSTAPPITNGSTTTMPPPPAPPPHHHHHHHHHHHKRTYSRTSMHRNNSSSRRYSQSLGPSTAPNGNGNGGPRSSQNSINNANANKWGENPRSSRASVRSCRERIVVVGEGGEKREYWQREEG